MDFHFTPNAFLPDVADVCAVCLKSYCTLATHRDFIARQQALVTAYLPAPVIRDPSFASSYAFNPLSVAIGYVLGEAQLDLDAQDLNTGSQSLPTALHKLISYDIGRNVPFTDPMPNSMGKVAAEWLAATSVDELACTSTLNLWVLINWRLSQKPGLYRYSSRLTTFFLEQLRKRVESDEVVTAGTIFAASNHLAICLIFFDQTNKQREVLMNGLETLVNACGGFETFAEFAHPGVFQSLLWSDVLYSCYTGSRPRFLLKAPPPMPRSLVPDYVRSSILPTVYQECCAAEILDTARHLKFFLLFRHGTEIRLLSKEEYHCMVALERYIHVQLLDQSARYRYQHSEEGSIDECLALALGLVRMSVLCIWEQHLRARKSYSQRLSAALERLSLASWLSANAVHILIWICYVMLAQSEPLAHTPKDVKPTVKLLSWALKTLWGEDVNKWSHNWAKGFADTLQPLLWHTDYDKYIPLVEDMVWEEYLSTP